MALLEGRFLGEWSQLTSIGETRFGLIAVSLALYPRQRARVQNAEDGEQNSLVLSRTGTGRPEGEKWDSG